MQRYIIFMLDVRARTPPASVDYVSADEGIVVIETLLLCLPFQALKLALVTISFSIIDLFTYL
jgi:hypothetical protein